MSNANTDLFVQKRQRRARNLKIVHGQNPGSDTFKNNDLLSLANNLVQSPWKAESYLTSKEISAFYETQGFITILNRAHHWIFHIYEVIQNSFEKVSFSLS